MRIEAWLKWAKDNKIPEEIIRDWHKTQSRWICRECGHTETHKCDSAIVCPMCDMRGDTRLMTPRVKIPV